MPAMRSLTFLALPLFARCFLCLPSCAWREIDVRADKVHAALRQLFDTMFKDMPKSRPEKNVDDTKLV